MGLSCSCGEWEGEGVAHYPPEDLTILTTKRRKWCCSCHTLIDVGAEVAEFKRMRYPITEIEMKIYGSDCYEVDMASWYMCQPCGEIYLNLTEIGYCLHIDQDMRDNLREYHELTGFTPSPEVAGTF